MCLTVNNAFVLSWCKRLKNGPTVCSTKMNCSSVVTTGLTLSRRNLQHTRYYPMHYSIHPFITDLILKQAYNLEHNPISPTEQFSKILSLSPENNWTLNKTFKSGELTRGLETTEHCWRVARQRVWAQANKQGAARSSRVGSTWNSTN